MRAGSVIVITTLLLSFAVFGREINYPNLHGIGKSSIGFAVLELALEKSGEDYQLVFDNRKVEWGRATFMLESGQIDVVDGGYAPEREERFVQIYLPLEMGLLGWRVFIIHKETAKRLASVQTVEDLKSFTFGQGLGWSDIAILEHAGLTVITGTKLENLVNMVRAKRFDILPLGANEAYWFLDQFAQGSDDLVVDDKLTLVYPFGRFYLVRKEDHALRQAIESGMQRALADGSLMALLKRHPFSRDAFTRAQLGQRLEIHIDTPKLTPGFRAIDPKWWFTP